MSKISEIRPQETSDLSAGITRPGVNYKIHACLAVFGLTIFALFYLMLTAWFGWTAYRLIASGFEPGGDAVLGIMTGTPAAFLAIFLIKALYFIKRGHDSDNIEITAEQEPKLFEFLNQLADEAGAPRPHKVFISPRVNASVFYDLSLLNFFFPARKNLEIGLGLVNVLNLGELKAVLAHEFGHFAQRSMAIGRWVYIAHQIAAHIIAQRDFFDQLIHELSHANLRIAWLGWILKLIVWSIRSLMHTAFSLVVLAERALSREMEFQADLVAVSLTGSDALIHALHKLHAADEAWDRTLGFIHTEAENDRAVTDIFVIQKRIIKIIATILNDPRYGQTPPLPKVNAKNHRIFKTALASPPRMWSTHPENSAREENAKQNYVATQIDKRSAWAIFQDPVKTRADISRQIIDTSKLTTVQMEESVANLDKQFNRAYYYKNFRGAYLGRSITRYADDVAELHDDYSSLADIDSKLATIYPESLSADLATLKALYEEQYTLEGIQAKTLEPSGGVIRHRGKEIQRKELPGVIERIKAEIIEAEKVIQRHDILCRTVHLAIAHRAGKDWEDNLLGLLALLHYADHSEANVRDMQRYLANIVAVITADERVTKKELKKLLLAANETHAVLAEIYQKAGQVELGRLIGKQLKIDNWQEALGEFELTPATEDNINEWLQVIDSWINSTINALSALNTAALEQLLKVEAFLAKQHRQQSKIPRAPRAPKAPTDFTTLREGRERDQQTKPGWWDRFYTADGFIPETLRFAVAASIVGAVIYLGHMTGGTTVTIYNGFTNTVNVNISGLSIQVPPLAAQQLELPPTKKQLVTTKINNQLLETFEAETPGAFGDYVYNVGQAMPLVEWTQVYGNAPEQPPRFLGTPHWFATSAQVIFQQPPEEVATKDGGATRLVLSTIGYIAPRELLGYVDKESEQQALIRQHVLWDAPTSTFFNQWMRLAADRYSIVSLAEERLSHYQHDIIALRIMQDYAPGQAAHDAVCKEHQALAEQNPDNSNLQYLSTRCISDEAQKDLAFIQGARQWPNNAWFHFAAGYAFIEQGNWVDAERALTSAMKIHPGFRETLAVPLLRLKRLQGNTSKKAALNLAKKSETLSSLLRLENGEELADSPYRFYSLLNKGDLSAAMTAANDMESNQARCIRLLAASEGAPAEIVNKALQLDSDQGIDVSTVWLSWALAIREGRDPMPYETRANRLQQHPDLILNALKKVSLQNAYADFEKDLQGTSLEERGYAYAAACLLLGEKAPDKWKKNAKSLLFAPERQFIRNI